MAEHRSRIDQELGRLIALTTQATHDIAQSREVFESLLEYNQELPAVLYRIWQGERDWHRLSEDLDAGTALIVLRVLEVISHLSELHT